jgi:aryl-alcohol dehydrogenase-like predicted oxidoreductase
VPATVARLVLPPIVALFLKAYPDIRLEVIVEDGFVDVRAAGCDAGIRYDDRLEQDMIAVQIRHHCSLIRTACADYAGLSRDANASKFALSQPGGPDMTDLTAAGVFPLGDRTVNRLGYGAMQLAGPGVFGPPKDRDAARAVLRAAVASGVNHIDTSDFYGPHITNQLIREALHPYPDDLVIVTKVGAVRGDDASWIPALTPADLTRAVHDNIRNLRVDALDVVNLRVGGIHGPNEASVEEQFATLAELQQQGLIRQLGLSNVTSGQLKQARRIAEVVCVQNHYNLVHRDDDALIDELADVGIAYVPFFPLGGFTPLQSSTLSEVAGALGAAPMQVALAWLLHRAPNVLLIPGTSSLDHLHENLRAAELELSDEVLARLDAIDSGGDQ